MYKPEHPRPDFMRKGWINLNGEWGFALSEHEKTLSEVEYNRTVNVPFSWACPLSGVNEDVKGYGYYRRTITGVPKDKRLFICFGGVDYTSRVFVNGHLAASHEGGYSPFEAEVTQYWNDGENEICVEACDFDEKYQTYGKQGYGNIRGIWQTVYLEARPENYIKSVNFIAKIDGTVHAALDIDSKNGGYGEIKFCFNGVNYDGGSINMKPGDNRCETTFKVDNPRLWSCEDPYLYEGTVTLDFSGKDSSDLEECSGGESTVQKDIVHTYFGIREIGTVLLEGYKTRHITLNGKPIYLNGTLDQSYNKEGYFTYPDDKSMHDEVWRLKRLGLNFVRIHIKPEEPRKLYWMDKLGIMVMEDMPCFWGEPDEHAKAAHEAQWKEVINRDFNHPSIISWVIFNESWGLLTGEKPDRKYLPETQEWVRRMYYAVKEVDPTRLVEDNSPCRYDHVVTDLNTWHFYRNGYESVKNHIAEVVEKTYPGSEFNYIGGNLQSDAPLMNSECGMVWGIEGSAGDSDISWHYHYMLNEFRLHGNICGFVFTEFHDVINEFNGYYRINDTDKYFGYGDFCRGMTLRDMHAQDFPALDVPPCSEQSGVFNVPVVISSFSDVNHGKELKVKWELWYDGLDGRVVEDKGEMPVIIRRYGTNPAGNIQAKLPKCESLCIISVWLCDDENVISRNFACAKVKGAITDRNYSVIEPLNCKKIKFEHVWDAMEGNKLCASPAGYVEYEIPVAGQVYDLTVYFEASSKFLYEKDILKGSNAPSGEYMLGFRTKPTKNPNTYYMTDEYKYPTKVRVFVDNEQVDVIWLPDDPADSRGVLSWMSQPTDNRHLNDAGSYGYLCRVEVPSRLIPEISKKGRFTLRLVVDDVPGGLALYGSKCGRYPYPVVAVY